MGRPLNKRYFGPLGDGTNIRVEANLNTTGIVDDAYIISQKGSNKFILRNKAGDANSETICRFVNKATASLALGEMVLFGSDGTGNRVPLKKITAHKATDYNNNQYTWEVQDDSTETILILTAI